MKKQSLLIPAVSLLMMGVLPSCSGTTGNSSDVQGYPVYTGNDHHLTYEKTEDFIATYKDGDYFRATGLNVFFDNAPLTSGQYYFTLDATNPKSAVLTTEDRMISPKNNIITTYYVAFDQDGYTYVSNGIEVGVNNPVAVDSWVYYTVAGAVVVALGIWSFVRAKAKKEGRA